MKTRIAVTLAALLVLFGMSFTGATQQAEVETHLEEHDNAVVRASRIIGMDVYNPHDEYLGEIEELVLDRENSDIAYAVLNYGGTLGFGGKYIAIPFSSFRLDVSSRQLRLDVSKERLDTARGFDWDAAWPEGPEWTEN